MPTVYLIHLDSKISQLAQHYLGYSALESVQDRFKRHKSGCGARLLQVANERKINYHIVRTWECSSAWDARNLERQLKRRHNSPKLCPICNPKLKLQPEYIDTAI